MPDKKRATVGKMTERRPSNPESAKTVKGNERARALTSARPATPGSGQPANTEKQLGSFEAAMKLFHAREFKEAREHFLEAVHGPERDVAHRAQLHAAMCDRRLQQITLNLRTAEDYYNYAVALLNTRQIGEARAHLQRALEMAPDADHIIYALAVAQALTGDAIGAHEHLRRAIELEPRNRILARQDGDFAALSGQPPFQALLYPEKKNW